MKTLNRHSEGNSRTCSVFLKVYIPVHIVLRGAYDGIPIRLKMQLPRIERNKVYELSVLNIGATVEGVSKSAWEEGETVTGKPDTDTASCWMLPGLLSPRGYR